MNNLTLKNINYPLPIYLPDATRGVIKSLDSNDLTQAKVEGVVVNTYHLMTNPGVEILEKSGGIKGLMNFNGLVVSDSGGFQVLSLIYQKKLTGKVTDEGVLFNQKLLTPELSIQSQFAIGSDIVVCLDDLSALDATRSEVEVNVKRTIEWAKRCKQEFDHQIANRNLNQDQLPLLMGVIQGGDYPDLRESCAHQLLKIGFDLYGYGGFPIDNNGQFRSQMLELTAKLIPDKYPRFALGVGTPQNIFDCYQMGYSLFDCVLPTRDARHGRLYLLNLQKPETIFNHLDIQSGKYSLDLNPIDPTCDCLSCQKYSRAYLHHLFKIEEFTAGRLASIHNLRSYTRLMEWLKEQGS